MKFSIPNGELFDPDFGLDLTPLDFDTGAIREGWNALRSQADERLAKYGFGPITQQDLEDPVHEISAEVGDDEESVSSNKAFVGLLPGMHQLSGQRISEEDTSISTRYGNLAEDLVILPDGYYQSYHNVRNTSSERDMSYLDVPKLRLAIDIRPGRMDHSATNDGKASMVGSRNSWIPRDSPIKGIYEIFSLYQDVNLGLMRDKRFAYLPQSLGGYGKPIPFSEPRNFERFNKAFRQGQYAELNREIIRRSIVWLHNESLGFEQERDHLLSHIVRFESSFHDWIKNKSIWCPVSWVDIPPELGKWQAGKTGLDRRMNNVFLRLASENRLVTEKKLSVAVEHNELCKALLGADNIVKFKEIRDSKIAEWRSLSLYTLKGYGYIKELRLDGFGLKPMRPLEILRFNSLVKDKRFSLKSTLRDEAYYWPEALKEVYTKGPMHVPFNCMPTIDVGRTYAENKYDIIDTEEIGALDALEKWVRNGAVGNMPLQLINDDDELIHRADENSIIALVTEDRALCREMNRSKGCPVFRVPVEWYYRDLYFGDNDRPWMSTIAERMPGFPIQYLEDSGSIKSFEELYFKDGSMVRKKIVQPFSLTKELGEKDPLGEIVENDQWDSSPPAGRPDIFDRRNLLKTRKLRSKRNYTRR